MQIIHVNEEYDSRKLFYEQGQNLFDLIRNAGLDLHATCSGRGTCGLCQIRILKGKTNSPTMDEQRWIPPVELLQGVRLACQVIPESEISISLADLAPRSGWTAISDSDYLLPDLPRRVSTPADHPSYGIAVDLGTSQLRVTLWDTVTGVRLAGRHRSNPQMRYGYDVLTRIMFASQSPERAAALSRIVLESIAGVMEDFAAELAFEREHLKRLCIVGNTAMLSLFSGKSYDLLLSPDSWNIPIACDIQDPALLSRHLLLKDACDIRLIQPLAGFVGSDLIAGVMATDTLSHPGSLLIDFGTNTEIALWDGATLRVTSVPGGAAFEGRGYSCGMGAWTGAIAGIRWAKSQDKPEYRVIGDTEPRGFCGSGLVDLLEHLIDTGALDPKGRFTQKDSSGQRMKRFLLDEKGGLYATPSDIDQFQRAKAATSSAIQILLRRARMNQNDIHTLHVSGAFGKELNIGAAMKLGLLPSLPPERIRISPNTALTGCELLLNSTGAMEESLTGIRNSSLVLNLAMEEEFENDYVNHLFLRPMEFR